MPYHVQLFGSRAALMLEPVTQLGYRAEIITRPEELNPAADICLAWGVFKIIKTEFLDVPRLGLWGFHESPLPKGRGCAPIHWTVLNKEPEVTVSFFKLVEEMDTGPLLAQAMFPIGPADVMEELREKATGVVHGMIRDQLPAFLKGEATAREQSGESTSFRRRTKEDSKLDTTRSLAELWDQIRVCDNDSYPAWFEMGGERIVLKRYKG